MDWIVKKNILIVGLGLIGGSYAKALTRLGYQVSAIDRNQESIRFALENEIIQEGSELPDPALISKADVVIFALYPHTFIQWVKDYQQYFKPGLKITDVTGVKAKVVYEIQKILRTDVEFIASHPMAGKEVSGVQYSDDRIFRDANFIVVPTEKNTEQGISWCYNLGRILGFRKISIVSPEEHDEMIGYVSQLTHCIAVSLMTCNDNEHLKDYTGDSFRDLTRIAEINEEMWSELFLMNKEVLSKQLGAFIQELSDLRTAIDCGDKETLKEKMRLSTKRRKLFKKKKEG